MEPETRDRMVATAFVAFVVVVVVVGVIPHHVHSERSNTDKGGRALLEMKATQLFHALDTNHDGQVNLAEHIAGAKGALSGLGNLQLTDEELAYMKTSYDANNDDTLSEDEIENIFKRIDHNGDQVYTREELAASMF